MNRRTKLAVILSVVLLLAVAVSGLVSIATNSIEVNRVPAETENETRENSDPSTENQAEQSQSKLKLRIFGRDKAESQEQAEETEDTVATIARATPRRNTVVGNRAKMNDNYNGREMNDAYRNDNPARGMARGRVYDGAMGDRPGVIGDEGRATSRRTTRNDGSATSRAGRAVDRVARDAGRAVERTVDRAGNMVDRTARRADRAIDNTFGRNDNVTTRSTTRNNTAASTTNYTFWGILIGLAIAAAVLALLAVIMPRKRRNRQHSNFDRH